MKFTSRLAALGFVVRQGDPPQFLVAGPMDPDSPAAMAKAKTPYVTC